MCNLNLGAAQTSDTVTHITRRTILMTGDADVIRSNLCKALVQATCPTVIVVPKYALESPGSKRVLSPRP